MDTKSLKGVADAPVDTQSKNGLPVCPDSRLSTRLPNAVNSSTGGWIVTPPVLGL